MKVRRYELFMKFLLILLFVKSNGNNLQKIKNLDNQKLKIISLDEKTDRFSDIKNQILDLFSFAKENYSNLINKSLGSNTPKNSLSFNIELPKGEICSKENCENFNAFCQREKICKCNPGFGIDNSEENSCNFKQSFQKYALLLEFIFPIGIGHFYCSRTLVGSIKFISLAVIPLFALFLNVLLSKMNWKNLNENFDKEEESKFLVDNWENISNKVFYLIYLFCFSCWFFYDIVMFSFNFHKDGYGFELISL